MIQRHKRYAELFEPDRLALLDALRACRNAVIDSQRRLRPGSPTYGCGSRMIEVIDDLAEELTGDRSALQALRLSFGIGLDRSLKRFTFHQTRFFAKALPDGDLRYFSNAMACYSSENAT